MVIGVFFMLLGALGPIAAAQWRSGHWLEAAGWIARHSSVYVLYASPVAGLLLACVGLSIMWPPAIVLVFLSAGAFMWALLASPHRLRAQADHEPTVAAPAPRTEPWVSGPFSVRPEISRRSERPGATRRPPTRRSRPGPSTSRKDVRRAS